jgi:hypothetical protein
MAEVAGQEVAHAHIMIAPDLKREIPQALAEQP